MGSLGDTSSSFQGCLAPRSQDCLTIQVAKQFIGPKEPVCNFFGGWVGDAFQDGYLMLKFGHLRQARHLKMRKDNRLCYQLWFLSLELGVRWIRAGGRGSQNSQVSWDVFIYFLNS